MPDLERVEADVREAAAQMASARDPAESEETQHGKRVAELVDQVTDAAVAELRTLRDQIDDQIRAMLARRDTLKADINEQVTLAGQAINVRRIASESVVQLTQSIERSLQHSVPKVITARKGNGAGK